MNEITLDSVVKEIGKLNMGLHELEIRVDDLQIAVEENRKAIEENRKAIEENRKAIEENRKAIEENRKLIERNHKEVVGLFHELLAEISGVTQKHEERITRLEKEVFKGNVVAVRENEPPKYE